MISNTLKSAMALREILRPKREEEIGEWRRLHKEELYDRYTSLNVTWAFRSKGRRRAGHVARMWTGAVHKRFWWGKPLGKRPLGSPRRRYEYNIKMNFQEVR